MDDTLRGLLQQIVTHPADDTVRLVYADRLDELGEGARAEFIRVQCEVAKHSIYVDDYKNCRNCDGSGDVGDYHASRRCRWCNGTGKEDYVTFEKVRELRRRERELLFACKPQGINSGILWLPFRPLTAQMKDESDCSVAVGLRTKTTLDSEFRYRRGFIYSLTCSAEDFLKHADVLVWHPEMTDECRNCDGAGEVVHDGNAVVCWDCKLEEKSGRIPRPMPDTAQPITKVKLTTRPPELAPYYGGSVEGFGRIQRYSSADSFFKCSRFPGITFELPSSIVDDFSRPLDAAPGTPSDYGFVPPGTWGVE
jgi:uncharacterized protein (TIGR02996 family)